MKSCGRTAAEVSDRLAEAEKYIQEQSGSPQRAESQYSPGAVSMKSALP